MHVHFLGICGTFMGSLALLAQQKGFKVTGQDTHIFPPMSEQLKQAEILIIDDYEMHDVCSNADIVVVGNVMTRGMPVIEALLEATQRFMSGPEFLGSYILRDQQHVLVVTGTHGKTTTSSLLAWILTYAGFRPGYLIGGVAKNLGVSAELGKGDFFVIEGDEYDTAFFDKRSKFLHYQPKTVIINNLEYDHADIFKDLADIQRQFSHLLRIIPASGHVIYNAQSSAIQQVLEAGCWSHQIGFGEQHAEWNTKLLPLLPPCLLGSHNELNALAAVIAAAQVGISVDKACTALSTFQGVMRRLEIKGVAQGVTIYSDFAHHPSAIEATLRSLRKSLPKTQRLIAIVDIGSNTMRSGIHQQALSQAVRNAHEVYFFHEQTLSWNIHDVWQQSGITGGVYQQASALLMHLQQHVKTGDQVVFMSNTAFGNQSEQLVQSLMACESISSYADAAPR